MHMNALKYSLIILATGLLFVGLTIYIQSEFSIPEGITPVLKLWVSFSPILYVTMFLVSWHTFTKLEGNELTTESILSLLGVSLISVSLSLIIAMSSFNMVIDGVKESKVNPTMDQLSQKVNVTRVQLISAINRGDNKAASNLIKQQSDLAHAAIQIVPITTGIMTGFIVPVAVISGVLWTILSIYLSMLAMVYLRPILQET